MRAGQPRHHPTLAILCQDWALHIGRTLAVAPFEASSGLERGHAGIALFLAALAETTGDRAFEIAAGVRLRAAADATPTMEPLLFSGSLGVAWVLELLGCDAEVNDATDAHIADVLECHDVRDRWELMYGLAGIGVYLLERPHSVKRTELLTWLVTLLDAVAHANANGVHWCSRLDPRFPDGLHQLGLAHGAAGVIVLLSRILTETDVATPAVIRLLEGSVEALRASRLPEGNESLYPSARELRTSSALAWCQGDLSVAIALAAAGDALRDPACLLEARELAVMSALRGKQSARVHDAGLCHGTIGLALMFQRLHDRFGDPVLADATTRWVASTLQLRIPGQGVGDVRTWAAGTSCWVSDPGFLVGAAGVGLGLLAMIRDVDPGWDRALGLGVVKTVRRGLP